MRPGTIVVVDSDWNVLDALSRALRAHGHAVTLATNGRTGLESAVAVGPDIVLVDQKVDVVDLRTFIEVLRDNPRTAGASIFVMCDREVLPRGAIDPRTQLLVKPLHANEIVLRIEDSLRAKSAVLEQPELHGDLGQVALFDLLQVFSTNRRTGTLRIDTHTGAAEIGLRDGNVVDATYGRATGDKALFRLMMVTHGQFSFLPNREPALHRVTRSTNELLMESARQADEVQRLRGELPAGDVWLVATSRNGAAEGVGREILETTYEPRPLEELVDTFSAPDLTVLEAIRDLLGRGLLVVDATQPARSRLCDDDEALIVSAAALKLRRPGIDGAARLGVIAPSTDDVSRFVRALGKVEEFVVDGAGPIALARGAFGIIGVVRLTGAELELFALPLDRSYRPLWGVLLAASRAVLWLGERPLASEASSLLDKLGVSVISAPAGWERPEGAVLSIRRGLGAIGHAQIGD